MCSDALHSVRKGLYGCSMSQNTSKRTWAISATHRPSTLTPQLVGQELGTSSVVDHLQGW